MGQDVSELEIDLQNLNAKILQLIRKKREISGEPKPEPVGVGMKVGTVSGRLRS
jgi:hypothetical protein